MRLKYNLLAAVQVLVSLLFFLMLASRFGAGGESDAFLIAFSITSSIQLLELMFIEQFLYFYQQKKAIHTASAKTFYQTSLLLALLVGGTFFTTFWLFAEEFIAIFRVFGATNDLSLVEEVFKYFTFGLLFYPATYVNDRLLNAEDKFALPYISETMPFMLMLLSFYYAHLSNIEVNVESLALMRGIGVLFGLTLTSYFLFQLSMFDKFTMDCGGDFCHFVKNSLNMRFAHNLNNFGVLFITNAFLVMLASGYASIFHYSLRGVTIIKQVIVGPLYRVFQSNVSRAFYERDFSRVRALMQRFSLSSLSVYLVIVMLSWLVIEPVLTLLPLERLAPETIVEIAYYFILVALWHGFMVAELPVTTIYMTAKDYVVFLYPNTLIVLVLGLTVFYGELNLKDFILLNGVLQLSSFTYYLLIYKHKVFRYDSSSTNQHL